MADIRKTKNYSRFCCLPGCKTDNKIELSFHKKDEVFEKVVVGSENDSLGHQGAFVVAPQDFSFPNAWTSRTRRIRQLPAEAPQGSEEASLSGPSNKVLAKHGLRIAFLVPGTSLLELTSLSLQS